MSPYLTFAPFFQGLKKLFDSCLPLWIPFSFYDLNIKNVFPHRGHRLHLHEFFSWNCKGVNDWTVFDWLADERTEVFVEKAQESNVKGGNSKVDWQDLKIHEKHKEQSVDGAKIKYLNMELRNGSATGIKIHGYWDKKINPDALKLLTLRQNNIYGKTWQQDIPRPGTEGDCSGSGLEDRESVELALVAPGDINKLSSSSVPCCLKVLPLCSSPLPGYHNNNEN